SSVYGGVVGARSALYARGWLKSHQAGVPVVIVGNLVAGGSGKTPLVIALVERLQAEGRKPGVATRGYGREQADKPLWVTPDTDPALAGDEPLLIARRTGARVRADRDRVAAAQALVAAGCDIVVCDDGLQHYRLARDIEIEVLDPRRRPGNDPPPPATSRSTSSTPAAATATIASSPPAPSANPPPAPRSATSTSSTWERTPPPL